MPLPSAIKLFIDPRTGNAFGNFSGTSSLTNPVFTLGDTATIELYLVEDTGLSAYPRQEIGFPTSPGIKVALGAIDESPLAGTWKLSYGGDTTTALAYNATPAAVQAALNLLASITAAGGVAVSKIGDNYNIVFNSNGARTELTTDAAALIPLSTAAVATLQTGDATKPTIYLVHLQRTVAGLATSFTPTTASAITVDALTAWDGSKATYRVSISPDPKGGSFSLAFDAQTGTDVSTSAISVGATALDVQNALNIGALAGKVSVTQVKAYAYDISVTTQPGTNGLTASAAGLLSYSGYKGELNLNTAEAISLLDGAPAVETTLEVEITSESKTLTVLQIPCTLHNAVIDVGALQPLVLDTYLSQTTADGRYFKLSQNLADGTAAIMRGNLSVYSTSQVDTALALKSNSNHTHIIGDVTGLQTAIDGKASTIHTHIISDVTGLQTAIDGKANVSHNHLITQVTGLQDALNGKADKVAPTLSGNVQIYNGNLKVWLGSSGINETYSEVITSSVVGTPKVAINNLSYLGSGDPESPYLHTYHHSELKGNNLNIIDKTFNEMGGELGGGEITLSAVSGTVTLQVVDDGTGNAKFMAIDPVNGVRFPDNTYQTTAFLPADYLTAAYIGTTYALLDSPVFSGTPNLPTGTVGVTQAAGDNTTALATTEFVQQEFPAASTTVAGKVELATNAETQAGFSTTLAVSPSSLAYGKSSPNYFRLSALTLTSATSGAGATGSSLVGGYNSRAPTSVTGYGIINFLLTFHCRGSSANTTLPLQWNKRFTAQFRYHPRTLGTDTNTVNRVCFGKGAGNVGGDLTLRGIEIRQIASNPLELLVHNGTSLTVIPTTFTPSTTVATDIRIVSDGTGNVTLFSNDVQIATTSAGPSTAGTTVNTNLSIESENLAAITGTSNGQYLAEISFEFSL